MLASVADGDIQHCSISVLHCGHGDVDYIGSLPVVRRARLHEISLLRGREPGCWGTRVGFTDDEFGRLGATIGAFELAQAA